MSKKGRSAPADGFVLSGLVAGETRVRLVKQETATQNGVWVYAGPGTFSRRAAGASGRGRKKGRVAPRKRPA
jgi:hypothetical protein